MRCSISGVRKERTKQVRCAKCRTENPDGLKFCNECDTPFKTPCASCGFENAPAAKFCGQCGAALGALAATASAKKSEQTRIRLTEAPAPKNLEGERKTVTTLFADIKGSMELIEDLDPEEARAIVDPALKLMMEAVHRYGGYVAQSRIFSMEKRFSASTPLRATGRRPAFAKPSRSRRVNPPNGGSCARQLISRDCCTTPIAAMRRAQILANIYNWFTERLGTSDLKDARALLGELSS
jgi:Double zinc ribbon